MAFWHSSNSVVKEVSLLVNRLRMWKLGWAAQQIVSVVVGVSAFKQWLLSVSKPADLR